MPQELAATPPPERYRALEAGMLGQQGGIGVDGADHLEGAFGCDGGAELGAGGGGLGHVMSSKILQLHNSPLFLKGG
jgi:hypothetical protein